MTESVITQCATNVDFNGTLEVDRNEMVFNTMFCVVLKTHPTCVCE